MQTGGKSAREWVDGRASYIEWQRRMIEDRVRRAKGWWLWCFVSVEGCFCFGLFPALSFWRALYRIAAEPPLGCFQRCDLLVSVNKLTRRINRIDPRGNRVDAHPERRCAADVMVELLMEIQGDGTNLATVLYGLTWRLPVCEEIVSVPGIELV